MISRIIKKTVDLSKIQKVDQLEGPLYQLENGGHTFEITCLMDGAAASVSGTVSARFLRADEETVYFTGTLTGNVVSITLPQSCYVSNGRFGLVVFVAGNDITSAIYAVAGNVYRSTSDHIIDPTEEIPSLEDLIAKIGECEEATADAQQAASFVPSIIASTYSTSVVYAVGDYCTYEGAMYRCTAETDGAFDPADWEAVKVGTEFQNVNGQIDDLKSALITTFTPNFEQGTISSGGGETDNTKRIRTVDRYEINNFASASCGSAYQFLYALYTGLTGNAGYVFPSFITELSVDDIPQGYKYIRFVVRHRNDTVIDPTEETDFVVDLNKTGLRLSENIADLTTKYDSELYPQLTVPFEQGGINSSGGEIDRTTRIRTKDYYYVDLILSIKVNTGFYVWYYEFDENLHFLRSNTTNQTQLTRASFSADAVYIRFVVLRTTSTADIAPSVETGFTFISSAGGEIAACNKKIAENAENIETINNATVGGIKNKFFSALPRYSFVLDNSSTASDHTVMGNSLLSFISSNDDLLTGPGRIDVRTYGNGFDHTMTGSKTIYHLLGHCNSVDYNADNDCLIFGNGSGSYTLAGKIIIIPDFQSIVEGNDHLTTENPLTLDNSNAIVIDCAEYNLGSKFNVIWGERNGTKNNIAYLITAKYGTETPNVDGGDNGTIRRILLGMGSNQLDNGVLIPAETDEFNGTFKIVDTYTQDGTTYAQANQGSCFHAGKIYACIGHDGEWIWAMNLDRNTNRIWYDEYKQKCFNDNGSVAGNNAFNTTGICYHDGFFFVGIVNIGVVAIRSI